MGIAGARKIVFENFRNLGIYGSKKSETRLDLGVIGTGGLICLIGANNEGKSNVLEGIEKLKDGHFLNTDDEPYFKGLERRSPRVWVEYNFDHKVVEDEKGKRVESTRYMKEALFEESHKSEELDKIFVISELNEGAKEHVASNKIPLREVLEATAYYGTNYDPKKAENRRAIFFKVGGSTLLCKEPLKSEKTFGCFCCGIVIINDNGTARIGPMPVKIDKSVSMPVKIKIDLEYKDDGLDEYGNASYLVGSLGKKYSEESSNSELLEGRGVDFPKIFFYKEQELGKLKGRDLQTTYLEAEQSPFFTTLFKILNLSEDVKDLKLAYERSKEKDLWDEISSLAMETGDKVKPLLENLISERFNAMYRYVETKNGVGEYKFHCRFDLANIVFSMTKNGEPIDLDRQSTGFQKFFQFFFNFLYKDEIGEGDIVLIDEPENSLSVPAQGEFRNFLRDFGRGHGITFVVSTHSPFMLSLDHLDEVRMVVRNAVEEAKGSWIDNDFSVLKKPNNKSKENKEKPLENITLNKIFEALGVSKLHLKEDNVVFVEGIMDHNVFSAYQTYRKKKEEKKDKEKTEGDKIQFTFLPIGGLGGTDENDPTLPFSQNRQDKMEDISAFAKQMGIERPLLLADCDEVGRAVKEGVADNPNFHVDVVTLKDAFMDGENPKTGFEELCKKPNIELETLFSQEDRERFALKDCKNCKIGAVVSSAFRSDLEFKKLLLSDETQNNLETLFKFLEKQVNQ
ncbi:AAA family ATPase [Helicobacter ailurogastricus]|uniref:AAA family ATPase n=1 Tax=Helicobacter ailurogastricus TaxID=1578720 RepID=UPI0022CC46D3|nr:AAA family ATPase [Helicobacter ailurogastricus]GLH58435.1 hypothetical protein NHP214376_12260 [Helicobacter ailurogastricus]GLH59899.1 hypothetical protein NHP214377_11700 [Helicobacter ailurogastricus]